MTTKAELFEQALRDANKEIKSDLGTLVSKLGDVPLDVEKISSGSLVLDSIAGGGLPRGRIIEIYGPEASGKTSIALTAVGNVQRNGGTALFVDFEHALDPVYAKKLGVDVDNLAVAQPDYAEQGLNLVHKMALSEAVDIIVVDSVAAMVPEAEFSGDMEQQTIGLHARIMGKALRKLSGIANRTNTTVIFINQIRDKVGGFAPYGTPTTTPGGKALKFFASMRIEVKKAEQVKEGSEVIGNLVKMKVVKNKVAPPLGMGDTVLTYGHGINVAAELVEVGDKLGLIDRPSSRRYVEIETGEIIGTSKGAAIEKLQTDTAMVERIVKRFQELSKSDVTNANDIVEDTDVFDEEDDEAETE